MKNIFSKNIKKISTLCFIFLCLSNLVQIKINSSEVKIIPNNGEFKYILGVGDSLAIKVYKSSEFNTKVKVLPDGTINLIRLGSIYVEGLTLTEAKELIEKGYSQILKIPIISLNLISSRALRVSVLGEVKRPGFYTIDPQNNNSIVLNSDGGEKFNEFSTGWPTLVEAIQRAGGITQNSNLREITLKRKSNENKRIINLYDPLFGNEKLKNPKIYDGDTIFIPRALAFNDSEISKISTSNLSAPSITVNIIGEVKKPGLFNISSDTPMNQAILFAGGFTQRANQKVIKLIRLRANGSILSKDYKYDISQKRNSDANPTLKDKDTIVVSPTGYAKLGDTLNNAINPLNPLIKVYRVYSLID